MTPLTINNIGIIGDFSARVGRKSIVPSIAPNGLKASAVAIAGAYAKSYKSNAIKVAIEPIIAPIKCKTIIFVVNVHDSNIVNGNTIIKFAINNGPTNDLGLYFSVNCLVWNIVRALKKAENSPDITDRYKL